LHTYTSTTDDLNKDFISYIANIRLYYDYFILFISMSIIALINSNSILIILSIIYAILVFYLNKKKNQIIEKYINDIIHFEERIRTYIINSKNNIINKNSNINHLNNKINNLYNAWSDLNNINYNLIFYANILTFIFIFIIIYTSKKKLSALTFLVYFYLLYDIQYITSKILEYFKNELQYNKLPARINYINTLIPSNNINTVTDSINKIIITKIVNSVPKLILNEKIVINNNDHILVDGISGSGKSSLLYILENIIKPDEIIIEPDINTISHHAYLTLPNYKGISNGKLYNIITDYSTTPNIELINMAINASRFNIELNNNSNININEISAGEHMRLLIAKIIYTIKNNSKYEIILFDEIDQNLNETLAAEICSTLLNIFNDKIILYITHNNNVKKLFKKKIMVVDGIINGILSD
jgi:ABC-type lipoprotein export system ATPase subunit